MFSFIVTVSYIHHVLRLNLKCDEKLATVFGAFRAQTHAHNRHRHQNELCEIWFSYLVLIIVF